MLRSNFLWLGRAFHCLLLILYEIIFKSIDSLLVFRPILFGNVFQFHMLC